MTIEPDDKTPATSTDITVANASTSLAVTNTEISFEDDAGMGMENIDNSMLLLPFLLVAQSMSPYLKKTEPSFIKGLEEGFLLNTATKKFWDGNHLDADAGINLVPCNILPKSIEWKPRSAGGGIVKVWDDNSYKQDPRYVKATKGSKIITPEGNEIVEYLDLFCIYQDRKTHEFGRILYSAKSTSIKYVRQLLSALTAIKLPSKKFEGRFFQPPLFYSAVRMSTVMEKNNDGSWAAPKFEIVGQTTDLQHGDDIYNAAKKFSDEIRSGSAKVDDRGREKAVEIDEDTPF